MAIIGIVLGVIALGLIYWLRREQQMDNGLHAAELDHTHHGMNAMMDDFNNYQVETDRKITHLEKQLEKTLGKQASFARAIDADPYLNAHRDILLNKYKPQIVERSIISEKEADRLIDSLSSFADLTDENTISLLYNSAQFYKLALESSGEIFNQKNFQSLYLSPLSSDSEAINNIERGFIPIEFRGMDIGFYSFYKSVYNLVFRIKVY